MRGIFIPHTPVDIRFPSLDGRGQRRVRSVKLQTVRRIQRAGINPAPTFNIEPL